MEIMSKIRISVTGHRPEKLWGYDYTKPQYKNCLHKFEDIISSVAKSFDEVEILTGMALGTDSIWACAAIYCKKKYNNIKLICVVPFIGQESKWTDIARKQYKAMLSFADETIIVSDKYSSKAFQKRNEYLVDNCDLLIALCDDDKSGTGNCMRYAESKNVQVTHFSRSDFE